MTNPVNNNVDQCLICSKNDKFMISLHDPLTRCEEFSVAEVLEKLQFLIIAGVANCHRKLCFICVAKIQSCFEFKMQCSQIEQQLKSQTIENLLREKIKLETHSDDSNTPHVEDGTLDEEKSEAELEICFEEVEFSIPEELPTEIDIIEEKHDIKIDPEILLKTSSKSGLFQEKSDDKKTFDCGFCYKSFSRHSYLLKHLQMHGESNFICDVCGKSFYNKYHLKKHKISHSTERKYACSYCSKSFKRHFSLIDHLRSHTGEKPYKCRVCNKSFARSCSLATHRFIHTREKPHACTVCDKSFSRLDHLKRHRMTH